MKINEIKQERKIANLEKTIDELLKENTELKLKVDELTEKIYKDSTDVHRANITKYEKELTEQLEQTKKLNEQYMSLVQLQADFNVAQRKKFKKESNRVIKELKDAF